MKYPKLLPGTVIREDAKERLYIDCSGSNANGHLTSSYDEMRFAIACTARCEWLDEAETFSSYARDYPVHSEGRKWKDAVDAAEHWRLWGKGEPWE